MAEERLDWEFRLTDEVSRAAGRMEKSIGSAESRMERWIHTFHDLEHVAEMTFEGIRKAAEFGEFIFEAREWKEQTMIGLRAVTGSADAAEAVFKMAEDFAIQTGQSTQEIVEASKRLTLAGYNLQDTRVLNSVLSDVKILQGAAAMDTVADALAKMGTAGHVTERTMLTLNSVAGLGGKVTDILSKRLHVSTDELKKLIAAGKVPKDWGAYAIAEGVRQLEGGKLNTVTKEVSQTFGGLIGSIKDEVMSLFTQGGGGLSDAILQPLLAVKDLLLPGGPFIEGVKSGFEELIKGFGLVGGSDDVTKFLRSLADGKALGADFKKTMRDVGEDVRAVVDAVGLLAKGIVVVAKAIDDLHGKFSGRELHDDLVKQGMRDATQEEIAKSVPVTSLSPSQRFGDDKFKAFLHMLFGDSDIEKGMSVIPKMAEGGDVMGPTLALIGEKGPERVQPLGTAGGGRRGAVIGNLNLSVAIHAGGGHAGAGPGRSGSAPDADPSALADTVADVILERLNSALEDLAMEGGVG